MNSFLGMLIAGFLQHVVPHLLGMGQKGPLQAPGGPAAGGAGIQAAQGPMGALGTMHGAKGPMGGVGALYNAQGALPHQQPGYMPRPGMGTGISSGPAK